MRPILVALVVILALATSPAAGSVLASIPTAPATLTVDQTLFDKGLKLALPDIEALVNNMSFPGPSESNGKSGFTAGALHITDFRVGGAATTLSAPADVTFGASSVTAGIAKTKLLLWAQIAGINVSCSGSFWVTLGPTTFISTYRNEEKDGRLALVYVNSNSQLGTLAINWQFPGDGVCKLGSLLLDLFKKSIDKFVRSTITSVLTKVLAPMVAMEINAVFSKIPYGLLAPPTVEGTSLVVTLDLLRTNVTTAVEGTSDVKASAGSRLGLATNGTRDVTLQVPTSSVATVLQVEFARGDFANTTILPIHVMNSSSLPDGAKVCPGACPISLEWYLPTLPQVTIGNSEIQVNLTYFILNLSAVTPPNSQLKEMITVSMSIAFSIYDIHVVSADSQHRIKFDVSLSTLSAQLLVDEIGPLDVSLYAKLLKYVLQNNAIPAFNAKYPGVLLPAGLNNVELIITPSTITTGFDLE